MATKKKALQAAAGAAGGDLLAIEDVFSTYLYTGNGSTQTITNGIDLAGEGGLVWLKQRDDAREHYLFDTARGLPYLQTHDDFAQQSLPYDYFTSYNSDGFTIPNKTSINENTKKYASWTWRKAPRWFDVVTYTGDGTGIRMIDHSLGLIPGAIVVKRTDSTSNWFFSHRGFNSGIGQGFLNLTNAFTTSTASDVQQGNSTDTQFYVRDGANTSGATYVAYLFAHDPLGPSGDGSDGLIACGSYTGSGSNNVSVELGWEPQWLLVKKASSTSNWTIVDVSRGMVDDVVYNSYEAYSNRLIANASNAESIFNAFAPTSTGFKTGTRGDSDSSDSGTFIYIAIRRGPMRQPESGTEVFATETLGATSPNPPGFNAGFTVDLGINRTGVSTGGSWFVYDRMRGAVYLQTASTASEASGAIGKFDYQDGYFNVSSTDADNRSYMFRRAPGFFDVVAYSGNGVAGRTVPHNLGVAPEMMIVKNRNFTGTGWMYYHKDAGNTKALWVDSSVYNPPEFNTSAAWWNNTTPTDAVFTVGNGSNVNVSTGNIIAYLFASLAGVSKVGGYTGNGSSQTIDCGFTTGARFVLIFREDAASDIYVWDTARGIVAANDPHLSLNTTVAEVTTDDSIDPDSSGFIVNQVAATNINVSSASYIYYAVS